MANNVILCHFYTKIALTYLKNGEIIWYNIALFNFSNTSGNRLGNNKPRLTNSANAKQPPCHPSSSSVGDNNANIFVIT